MSHPRLAQFLALASVAIVSSVALAQHNEHARPTHDPQAAQSDPEDPAAKAGGATARPSDPYPLTTCPVSGKKLGDMGEPVVRVYDGREVKFCCDGCIEKFEASKAKYWQKIEEAIAAAQMPFYPLTTCIVSDEPLVEDGQDIGVDYVYQNRLIRFCCKGCVKGFLKNPEPLLVELDAATIQQQRDNYPLTTCIVSGEELGSMGETYDVVINNHLIRLCCQRCERDLRAHPLEYLPKLDDAWKRQGMPHPANATETPDSNKEGGK